jgi:parallel beta-helix repeat protein
MGTRRSWGLLFVSVTATPLVLGVLASAPARATEPVIPIAGPASATPVPTPAEPVLQCSVNVTPSENLTAVVAAAPARSTFCLAGGTYAITSPVVPENGDHFLGAAADRPIIDASATTIGIDARAATNVVLENIVVSGATLGSSPTKCPACGRGIFAGDAIQLWNVELTANAQNGMSGSQNTSDPWLIVDSQIIGNGDTAELGYASGGIKGTNPYTILNSYVADNIGSGIWCDVGCIGGTWVVEGNTVIGNTRDGIRYEVSAAGATIEGNDVEGNNTSSGAFSGIQLAASDNATVQNNVSVGNTGSQIRVSGTGRKKAPLVNDSIIGNSVNGGKVIGCNLAGVTCSGNL